MCKESKTERKPNRTAPEVLFRDAAGNKQCVRCSNWLGESEFYPSKVSRDALKAFCRRCAASEDSVKRHHLGMPAYLALLETQDNKCAICKTDNPYPDMMWTIDHDHNCCSGIYSCGGCIRGLICRKCNMGVGLFNESASILLAASTYLGAYYG